MSTPFEEISIEGTLFLKGKNNLKEKRKKNVPEIVGDSRKDDFKGEGVQQKAIDGVEEQEFVKLLTNPVLPAVQASIMEDRV